MGVNHLIIEPRAASLVVGGVEQPLAVLRDIGKSAPGTRAAMAAAAHAWDGRVMPKAALCPGAAGDGIEGEVHGWEEGLGGTTDWDHSGLPLLGVARLGDDGRLHLHADAAAPRAMTPAEARERGIVGADGALKGWRRPRVADAEVVPGWREVAAIRSSLGEVARQTQDLRLVLDNGREERFATYEELRDDAPARAPAELRGLAMPEVEAWVAANRRRDWVAEGREVGVAGGTGLALAAGGQTVWMRAVPPSPTEPSGGILVTGAGGGAGFPQIPERAFLDAGDRLARKAGVQGIRLAEGTGGYLALSAGAAGSGLAVLVVALGDGDVAVISGTALPASFAAAIRGEVPLDLATVADLLDWPKEGAEEVRVPAARVGPFLADFALYLRELSGASLRRGRGAVDPLPTFGGWLARNVVRYGS